MSSGDRADVLTGVGAPRDHLAVPLGDARVASRRRDVRIAALAGALAAIAGGGIVFAAQRAHLAADFPAHIGMTLGIIREGRMRGEFLFFVTNALIAGFSTDPSMLQLSLTVVLALAIGAKVVLSVRFAAAGRAAALAGRPGAFPVWGAAAVALCSLAATMPVAGHRYLGLIPPNVWHNSTTIFLMPFALGVFWTTLRFLETGATRWLWWSALLGALSLAAKPSFMLCLLPAFALFVLLRFRTSAPARRAAPLAAGIVALVVLQTAYVYTIDPTMARGTGIALVPLAVWHSFSRDIPLSLVASLVFPLTALALGGGAVRGNLAVRYAGVTAAVALAEYALLAERGPYRLDGNMTWQAIVAMWVLFVALVSALVPWYERTRLGPRQVAVAAAFLVQVIAGALFLQHWFATGSYS